MARARRSRPWWTGAALAFGCALALRPALARAADATGSARVAVGAGYDGNASRELEGPQALPDGVAIALGAVQGRLAPRAALSLSGQYELGAKRFMSLHDEDLLAQRAAAEAALHPLRALGLGITARGKDLLSRGGGRDHRDLAAGAFAELRIGRPALRMDLSAERFDYWPAPAYSFAGPAAELQASVPLARRHRLEAQARGSLEAFDGGPRADRVIAAGARYVYRGRVTAELGYAFLRDFSSSFGQGFWRHRLHGSAAVRLPLGVILAGTGALQLTRFPDGLALAPELLLLEDDESTDQLAVKLVRPLPRGLELELKGAVYRADFPGNGLSYRREAAQLLLGWRGEGSR